MIKYFKFLPKNCACNDWGLGEGKEWDEVRSEDAEEEDIAELPARGHDDWDLVVDQEHRQDLGNHDDQQWWPLVAEL